MYDNIAGDFQREVDCEIRQGELTNRRKKMAD